MRGAGDDGVDDALADPRHAERQERAEEGEEREANRHRRGDAHTSERVRRVWRAVSRSAAWCRPRRGRAADVPSRRGFGGSSSSGEGGSIEERRPRRGRDGKMAKAKMRTMRRERQRFCSRPALDLAHRAMTSMSGRAHDVVVFGATGFTGRLVVEYLASHAPSG